MTPACLVEDNTILFRFGSGLIGRESQVFLPIIIVEFKVKVLKVAIINKKGKEKQMTVKSGGRTIKTSGYTKLKKRALVTLIEGYNIDLFSI